MSKVKEFTDTNTLTKNAGYNSIDTQINNFISSNEFQGNIVISIQYSTIFNELVSSAEGVKGVIQKTALVHYRKKKWYE